MARNIKSFKNFITEHYTFVNDFRMGDLVYEEQTEEIGLVIGKKVFDDEAHNYTQEILFKDGEKRHIDIEFLKSLVKTELLNDFLNNGDIEYFKQVSEKEGFLLNDVYKHIIKKTEFGDFTDSEF